jgi:hypothetical protein
VHDQRNVAEEGLVRAPHLTDEVGDVRSEPCEVGGRALVRLEAEDADLHAADRPAVTGVRAADAGLETGQVEDAGERLRVHGFRRHVLGSDERRRRRREATDLGGRHDGRRQR